MAIQRATLRSSVAVIRVATVRFTVGETDGWNSLDAFT